MRELSGRWNVVKAVRVTKEVINHGFNIAFHEGLDLGAMHWNHLCGTEDQEERAAAFIKKQKPDFVER